MAINRGMKFIGEPGKGKMYRIRLEDGTRYTVWGCNCIAELIRYVKQELNVTTFYPD